MKFAALNMARTASPTVETARFPTCSTHALVLLLSRSGADASFSAMSAAGPEGYLDKQNSLAMRWGLDRQMECRCLAEGGGSLASMVAAERREGACICGHVAG